MNPTHKQNLKILADHGIKLSITHKKVKNINFRIKVGELKISVPRLASEYDIAYALNQRMDWILKANKQLISKQQSETAKPLNLNQPAPIKLWGKAYEIELNEPQRLQLYRQQLSEVMPALFAKWQPIVGKTAKEQRIKKMKTRWGSCNIKAKRIWLSVYLPEYPLECSEYVIVHELCHLHHANHSPQFWAEVARAMPDYKRWHDLLAGKKGDVD